MPATRAWPKTPSHLNGSAADFDVSRECVRQVEVRTFEKVQAAAKSSSAATIEAPPPSIAAPLCVSIVIIPVLLAALIAMIASGLALATIGSTLASAETATGAIGQPQALKPSRDTLNYRIAYFKSVLRLTAAQERLWPPVESALRGIAQHKVADEASDGGIRLRIVDGATEFTLSIAELQRFISIAQPLIDSLDQSQKHDAFVLAQTAGFGSVAEKFR